MIKLKGFGARLRRRTDVPLDVAIARHVGRQLRRTATPLDLVVEAVQYGDVGIVVNVDYRFSRTDRCHGLQHHNFRAITVRHRDGCVEFGGQTLSQLQDRMGSSSFDRPRYELADPDAFDRVDLALKALIGMSEAEIEVWKFNLGRPR